MGSVAASLQREIYWVQPTWLSANDGVKSAVGPCSPQNPVWLMTHH
ncbi:hypothetical protein FHU10_1945 [Serratia fonticola]|jgi:hypothetical protein|uniref:Uncharacterized protein n=1 Tax=Serratia fonticola TaxID=47917 RepID=A0A559T4A5_SERFO|nr:hypothetical protein [Serratia fonticola]TQI78065.1 hypothetical protein FHU09_0506 [Serratia fonticola]TQI94937.1 hypothetical protein FHU11_0287 [Serratia fonticola]TVZ69435.1 hypothetical protein FHU10_1945 [Serratia fonticola]